MAIPITSTVFVTKGLPHMPDSAYKLIELVGTSSISSDDAVRRAIERAGESLRNLRWFEVTELRGRIDDDKQIHWQATVKVGFHLEEP